MFTSKTDAPAEVDLLGIENYIGGLSSFIDQCSTPLTIAIKGDWGTGKTSIMKQIDKVLRQEVMISDKVITNKIKTIFFNTWQYSQFDMAEDLGISLMTDLIEELNPKGDLKKTLVDLSTIVFPKILKCFSPSFSSVLNGEEVSAMISDYLLDRNQNIKKLKDTLNKLISDTITKNNYDRLVIFIDDLDRLVPKRAVELLEVLKLFLDCEHCVFVLAIDYNVVIRGVHSKYSDDFDDVKGRAFFDKLIQVPFTVPVANYNINQFINQSLKDLGFKVGNDTENTIEGLLIKSSIGSNPRSINRLINSTSLLFQVSKNEDLKNPLNKQLLLATVCLQLAYENIYSWMLNTYNKLNSGDGNDDDRISDMITLLENNFDVSENTTLQTNLDREPYPSDKSFDKNQFKEFYSSLKKLFSKNGSDDLGLTQKNIDQLMYIMTLSNTVASGNIDIKQTKQNHSANEDVQYIIRKLFNRLSAEKKISINLPQKFGTESVQDRTDDLSADFKRSGVLDTIRLTQGKGQGLNISKKNMPKDEQVFIYLSGDSHGSLINDGMKMFKGKTVIDKVQKNEFTCHNAHKLRNNPQAYEQFEKEIIQTLNRFIKSFEKYEKTHQK